MMQYQPAIEFFPCFHVLMMCFPYDICKLNETYSVQFLLDIVSQYIKLLQVGVPLSISKMF